MYSVRTLGLYYFRIKSYFAYGNAVNDFQDKVLKIFSKDFYGGILNPIRPPFYAFIYIFIVLYSQKN